MGLEILSAFVDRLSTRFKSYVVMGKLTLLKIIVGFDMLTFFLMDFIELILCECKNVILYNPEIYLAF